jgi:hypothetical protein
MEGFVVEKCCGLSVFRGFIVESFYFAEWKVVIVPRSYRAKYNIKQNINTNESLILVKQLLYGSFIL